MLQRWEMVEISVAARPPPNKCLCLFFFGDQLAPMLLLAGPGGEGGEHAVVGLATKQRRCHGSPCAQHAVTVIVAAMIFGRSSGLISTSTTEAFRSVIGARHAQETKWFVPGVLGVAGGWIQSPEKSSRADCSLISAAEPRGRR
jgi:hypothetical protein